MSNSRIYGLLICIGLLYLTSCKSKKAVVTAEPPKKAEITSPNATLMKTIWLNENSFNFYNARGSANYQDGKQSFDFNIDITMEKDRYVYMNITALLGISVARLWFTQDSVCILDVLHRKNIVADYNYISKIAGVGLSLTQVQQLLAGNAPFKVNEQKIIADTMLAYIVVNFPLTATQSQSTYYHQSSYHTAKNVMTDRLTGREVRVEYTECYTSGSNCFPKDMNIHIRAEKNIDCGMNLDYFAFDKKKEVKFVVPKNFQTVRM